jgi:hypothetical protein
MKKTILALLPVLALCPAAHAQFTFTGFTGKTMQNASKPAVRIREKDASGKLLTTLEHYFIWGKDSVKIQSVMFDQNKPNMVRENIFYYADFMPENTKAERSEATKSIESVLSSKGGASVPTWENTDVYYSEAMRDLVSITFESKAQGQAFLAKLAQKKRQASATPQRLKLKNIMKEKKQ